MTRSARINPPTRGEGWSIGFGKPSLRYRATRDGVVTVNGAPGTGPSGRLVVTLFTASVTPGGASVIAVRVRVDADDEGNTLLYADEVAAGNRQRMSVATVAYAEGSDWVVRFTHAVHDGLSRRAGALSERLS